MADVPLRPARSLKQILATPWVIPTIVAVVVAIILLAARPNYALVMQASPVIQLHLAAALIGFGLGVVMLNSRKGRTFHRTAGWVWAVAMTVVVISSFFIHEIFPGHFSYIHLLSGYTAVTLPIALVAAKRHNVKLHRRNMVGMFFGGMIIAGGFTFLPGRLIGRMFFGG